MDEASDLEIRVMRRNELDVAVEWAAQEGWNPGLADADCFLATDPNGFLLGFVRGEPVASISVVRYAGASDAGASGAGGFGFLGFYIVRPDMRGRGLGLRLWQAGIAYLEGCTIGLDGVVAQQDNYRQSGFVLAHRNVRYGGTPRCAPPHDTRLTPIGAEHVQALIDYDRAFFPAPRATFLRCWLRPDHRHGLALIENGTVSGYGVIRACRSGFKIGPLFAETEQGADMLFQALAATAADEPVFLDGPEPNQAATQLAGRYGLSPVFETARMYRGPAPDLPLSRIFGITTFELG
jgi:predicted N-acetyltransferase YhbS